MKLKVRKGQLDSAKRITDLIPQLKNGCSIDNYEVIGVNNGRTLVHSGRSDSLDASTVVILKNVAVKTKIFIDVFLRCANGRYYDNYKLTVTP